MIRNVTMVFLFLLILSCRGKIQQAFEVVNKDTTDRVEVISADGKRVDYSKYPAPPPPTKEDLERERTFNKKKGIVKIVKDCCVVEDCLDPLPPVVNKV